MMRFTHADILADYQNFFLENRGRNFSPFEKFRSPTANDLGNGSVNLGSAIDLLQRYRVASNDSDPLLLNKYYNDYAKLAMDLIDPLSGATEKFAGLMIKRGQEFFQNEGKSNWASRPAAEQEALLIWFYNVGELKATQNYMAAREKWRQAHPGEALENFVWEPNITPDFGPEGVQEHLLNRDALIVALNNPLANSNVAVARPDWAVLYDAPWGVAGWDGALGAAYLQLQSAVVPDREDGVLYAWDAPDGSGYSISLTKVTEGSSFYITMVEVVSVNSMGQPRQVRTSRFQPMDPDNPTSTMVRTDILLEEVDPLSGARRLVKRLSSDVNDLQRIFALQSDRSSGWRVSYKVIETNPGGGTVEHNVSYLGGKKQNSDGADEDNVIVVTGTRSRNALGELLRPSSTEYAVYDLADDPKRAVKEVKLAGDIGAIFGSTLGRQIVGSNVAAQIGASTILGAIGRSLGESIDSMLQGVLPAEALRDGFSRLDSNILNGGIGAISAFLFGELLSLVGLEGIPAEVAQSVAGHAVTSIATNIISGKPALENLDLASFGNVIGSLAGSMLASQVINFDTIGGQLGASLGASIGSIVAGTVLVAGEGASATLLGVQLGAFSGPIGAAIGAFVGFILGGLIGSLFGGTPRSFADASWDQNTERFQVTNVSARKGGSKEAARGLAQAAADTYNSVLSAIGGTLVNGFDVRGGTFGMRAKDFVYWDRGPKDAELIDIRSRTASVVLEAGIYNALSDMRIAGGDVFLKRALSNHLALVTLGGFSTQSLMGDLTVAQDYSMFHDNGALIGALILAQEDSVFAAGWTVTLARAWELGLHRRGEMDWEGGFSAFLHDLGVSAGALTFSLTLGGALVRQFRTLDGRVIADTIAVDTTSVSGTSAADTIDLGSNIWAGKGIDVAAAVSAGDGDDFVQASGRGDTIDGGAGNDTLYGGRLDDWLIGGEGDDILDAGSATPGTLGGDGNYLNGGAGNDILRGREGSDWLEGGDGTDLLEGGAGDDILAGGAGNGDVLHGGSGADQYILRRGDGADIVEDIGTASSTPATSGIDAVSARMAAIALWRQNPDAAGAIRPDWEGTSAGVSQGQIDGGEDAVVFGTGISIGDIRMQRSGTSAAPGGDLIITIVDVVNGVEQDSDTTLTIKDWFIDPFKRVEWLKFADGTSIRIGDITSFVIGGSGNDVLIGTSGNDFVYGGAGNDQLFLLAGDDVGLGGTGNDMVIGDAGRDLIVGGLGNDQLIGDTGGDAISGDDGTDTIYGGADSDILSGGRGDGDVVVGGSGDDIFKYSRGDGNDVMADDFAATAWDTVWTNGTFASGYAYDAATGIVTAPDGTVIRRNMGTAEAPNFQWIGEFAFDTATATLRRFAPPAGTPWFANNGTDTIEFGADINIQDIMLQKVGDDLVLVIGKDGSEGSAGSATDSITIADWYSSGLTGQIEKLAFYQIGVFDISAGARTLIAGTDGDDGSATNLLAGTSGADWITGAAGNDWIAGGQGDDVIAGNSGADTLRGEQGDDVLYGGVGNDVLDGGSGKDVLVGGGGFDIASYASATMGVYAYLGASARNTGDAAGDTYSGIEGLAGSSGADHLYGDEGDNELTGGGGADELVGGTGDDTYIWNAGDGSDTILDATLKIDEIVSADGTLASGFTVTVWESTGLILFGDQSYWHLQIQDSAGAIVYDSSLHVGNQYSNPQPTPAQYLAGGWTAGITVSGDGQVLRMRNDTSANGGDDVLELGAGLSLSDLQFVWSGEDLLVGTDASNRITLRGQAVANTRIETLQLADGLAVSLEHVIATGGAGTAADDLVLGSADADTLAGGDGNDTLVGYAGNDTLLGGAGDDVIEGGAGADQIDGGANSAIGSSTGAGDTARYVGSSAAVTIDLSSGAAQSGGDAAGDVLTGIENVVGTRFGDTITGDAGGNRLAGLDGDDTLRGGGGDDVLLGDGGNDLLYGDDGVDAIAGGEGNDQLWGGAGNDQLDGGEGNDTLWGEAGDDTLTAGLGNDTLDGGDGNDMLVGDAGNDTLNGGAGNDTLNGGIGNDILAGGLGDDRYTFDAKSGVDSITDASGTNMISFADVEADRLWMIRDGNDLKISVIGGDSSVTVTGFFATTGGSKVRAVQTATKAYYLDNTDSLRLITAMTAATTAGATPATMPKSITDQLETFWHAGGKSAPTAPTTPIALSMNEDGSISFTPGNYVVDHDGGPLTYSVKDGSGLALGTVSLSNATLKTYRYTGKPNKNGSDSFTMIATDSDGQSTELKFAVTIAPVNDAPYLATNGTDFSVVEGAVVGTVIGRISATDADGDVITYTLMDFGFPSAVQISLDGLVTVRDPLLFDREISTVYSFLVSMSDGKTSSMNSIGIKVTDVNEANSLPSDYSFTLSSNIAANTAFGQIKATDLDKAGTTFAQQVYFFRNGTELSAVSSDGLYAINQNTGAISAVTSLAGAPALATYEVVARDNAGNAGFFETSTQVHIEVLVSNNQNALPATSSMAVDEGVVVGTVVGTVVATDPDSPDGPYGRQRYYFLNGAQVSSVSSDGRYAIDENSGEVRTLVVADRETLAQSSYTVVARDNDGQAGFNQAVGTLTVTVNDRNEANALSLTQQAEVSEGTAIGTQVVQLAATDLDAQGTAFAEQRYYFLLANGDTSTTSSDGRFIVDSQTGIIRVNAALDFETGGGWQYYSMVARDNAGVGPYNQSVTRLPIYVRDVNEPNSLPASTAFMTIEGTQHGTPIGTITATDPDGPSSSYGQQRYYFGATHNNVSADGYYGIDAWTGVVTVLVDVIPERGGTSSSYEVIARDSYGNGNIASTNLTITVRPLNQPNSLPAAYGFTVAENVANSVALGQVVATDPDLPSDPAGQQLYLFENGLNGGTMSADGRFVILADGTLNAAQQPDFESWPTTLSYVVLARDNNGGGRYNEARTTVTITLTDVNEAPTGVTGTFSFDVAERDHVASGTQEAQLETVTLGSFGVTDPDTAGSPFATYGFTVSDERFEMVGNTLRLKQGASLDYEAGATLNLNITATDGSLVPFGTIFTVQINVLDRDDVIEGTSADDTLNGAAGRDLLYGYDGNDLISAGDGNDYADGGAGDDRVLGGAGNDELLGGAGADRLGGGDGSDVLRGGANDVGTFDMLFGEAGNDTLYGGDGDDRLFGGGGSDILDGGAGSDWADYSRVLENSTGSAGPAVVDLANNALNGGSAIGDTMVSIENVRGSALSDRIYGDAGANILDGGNGYDVLEGREGDDTLSGGDGNDTMRGGEGNDHLYGDAGDDIIYGGTGNDWLYGGDGDDQLYAESGDDMLDGGGGNDFLRGGANNDTYLMNRTTGQDTIENYDGESLDGDVDVIGFNDETILDEDIWFQRDGDDMIVSIIGTDASARIKNWYLNTDNDGANYKIDFITTSTRYTRTIDVEGLVDLMGGAMPTEAARDDLMKDATYLERWTSYWNINQKPVVTNIGNQTMQEDGTLTLTIRATDDVTPTAAVQMHAEIVSGGQIISLNNVVFGIPNSNGERSMILTPSANLSGVSTIRVWATDAGDRASEVVEFTVTVAGVADTPVIAGFAAGAGTSGGAGIPLAVNVSFADMDGSEFHELQIEGVPAGVTLSAGTYDATANLWRLTPAQAVGLTVLAPAGWSSDLLLKLTAVASENGQTRTVSASTTMVINAPPTAVSISGGSIAENSASSAIVGTLGGVDPDGDTLTFQLLDNAGGRFALANGNKIVVLDGSLLNYEAAGSHVITVRAIDAFSQVRDQSFTITVANVNEAPAITGGGTAYFDESAPGAGTPVTAGLEIASFGMSDPDGTTPTLEFTSNPGGLFKLTGNKLQFVGALDYESLLTHAHGDYNGDGRNEAYLEVRVRATDGALASAEAVVKVYVQNVNEAPTVSAVAAQYLDEAGLGTRPANAGAAVATFATSDPDGTAPVLQLVGNPGDLFYLDGNTVRIKSGVNLDFEWAKNANFAVADRDNDGRMEADLGEIVVRASDGSLVSGTTSTHVYIEDVNEAPTISGGAAQYLDETGLGTRPANAGVAVATYTLGDPDIYGAGPVLQFVTNPGDWFYIDGNTVRLKAGVSFNFEALGGSVDHDGDGRADTLIGEIAVRASDGSLTSGTITTKVYIQNVNEAPTVSAVAAQYLDETGFGARPANAYAVVATFATSDPDGTTPALQLVTNPGNWFYVDGNQVRIKPDLNFDFEALRNAGYLVGDRDLDGRMEVDLGEISVRASDGSLVSATTSTHVYIEDVNEAPTISGSAAQYLDETGLGTRPANANVVVASYTLGDPDVYAAAPVLQLVTNPNNWFYIDGNTVRLKAGVNFDFEALGGTVDHDGDGRADTLIGEIAVRASDGSLTSGTITTKVYIQNVNEAPYGLTTPGNVIDYYVNENAGFSVTLSGVDPEGGDLDFAFGSGGNANGWFAIDNIGTSGTLRLVAPLDFEAVRGSLVSEGAGRGYVDVYVRATDGVSYTGDRLVRVHLNNLNDIAPSTPSVSLGTTAFNEADYSGTVVATLSSIDGDNGLTGVGYYLSNNPGNYFEIVGNQVRVRSGVTIDYEAIASGGASAVRTIQVYANDGGYNSAVASFDVQFNNQNDNAPTANGVTPQLNYSVPVSENLPALMPFATFNFGDADGSALNYEIIGDVANKLFNLSTYSSSGPTAAINLQVKDLDFEKLGLTGAASTTVNVVVRARDASNPSIYVDQSLSFTFENRRNYLWQNGATAGYTVGYYQTRAEEGGYFFPWYGSGPGWVNEWVLAGEEGVVGYHVEMNAWPGGFTLRPEYYARYAQGYVVVGTPQTYQSFVVYADDETVKNTLDANGYPIGLDLDGGGIATVGLVQSTARYDMDGDGLSDRTAWIGAGDGILALDRDGDGIISRSNEISFVGDKAGAKTDLEGLAGFDTNGDLVFDGRDAGFGAFLVWQDANQDGVSQAGELRSLAEVGIVSISLIGTPTGATPGRSEALMLATASYTRADGSQHLVGDIVLPYLSLGDALRAAGVLPVNATQNQTEDSQASAGDDATKKAPTDALAAPIILDLDGDGKTIVALADSTTLFDMVGDGQLHRTAWLDAGDAFLVRDRNGNGVVDGVGEISFVGDKAGAKTDLEGLAGFDGNGDGKLDANDSGFVGFSMWIDGNNNGRTDAGELQSLAQAGISSISLTGTPTGQTAAQRTGGQSVIFNTASFTYANGTTGTLSDAGLAYDTVGQGAVSAWGMKPILTENSFDMRFDKARISAVGGRFVVRSRGTEGLFDPLAGAMSGATYLHFRDKTVGMLGVMVLDLDGDGIDLEHKNNTGAAFDLDGNGGRDDTGWIGKGDGFLVIDRNDDGQITTGSELSFLGEKSGVLNNFDGLGALDANRDGKINATDARFSQLKVWIDGNRNGRSDEGELKTLGDLGISEIGLSATGSQAANQKLGSNIILSTAVFTQNGRTKTVADVALAFSPAADPIAPAAQPIRNPRDPGGLVLPRPFDADIDMPDAELDGRLALMRQAMGGFAIGGALDSRLDKMMQSPQFEFHAATA